MIARHLLSIRADWPQAHYLLVRAWTALGADHDTLDAHYAYLVRTDPLEVSTRFARGLYQLRTGNFEAGWDAHEWRWNIEPAKSLHPICTGTRWAGGPLEGRRLLVIAEQGFGDILQFARYLPLLVERGASVILQLDENRASLRHLLSCLKGVDVVTSKNAPRNYDLFCPLASLPYVFGTTADTIPSAHYLNVDSADVESWTRLLAHLPRPWVGVCWAGSADHSHDIRRTLPLSVGTPHYAERQAREERIIATASRVAAATCLFGLEIAAQIDARSAFFTLEALLRRTEGSLVSLQVGPRANEVNELPKALRSRMFSVLESDVDFYDTACLMEGLDYVISVDTSIAHLAGSLGKPGLIVKPAAPEWRWIEKNGKSSWYPTLSLVEQHEISSE